MAPKTSWGETSLFFNPSMHLPHAISFCTIKNHDRANNRLYKLDRLGVFRLAIGLFPEPNYLRLFGPKAKCPEKSGAVNLKNPFTALNKLMPHPVYGWMGWAQILSPTKEVFSEIFPYIEDAHRSAV